MIKIVKSSMALRTARLALPNPVGLVPTMGYLHDGHLSLVQQAIKECQSVVTTIFVNPTQFGPDEDLLSYPRDVGRDLQMLEDVGCDLVWLPTPEMMYPTGYQTWVRVDELTRRLEGEHRPGHFPGVATVVAKLFNWIQPQYAYFGQKDAQQAIVIERMTKDLNFPIEIITSPTIRETDGLAMSSRNAYLNENERRAASILYQSLLAVKDAVKNGERIASQLKTVMADTLNKEPSVKIQYISIANPVNLEELDHVDQDALFSLAAFLGNTRLIDNFLIRNGIWHTGKIINSR